MICAYCKKEILLEGKHPYKILPLDRPYVNIYLHNGDCLTEVNKDVKNFLTEYLKGDIISEQKLMKKTKRK